MQAITEPSPATYQEIGALCVAWSYLEVMSEITLWGILDADERLGPIITGNLDLRGRWQAIMRHARQRLEKDKFDVLHNINKMLETCMRDRNIIIHGLVHAMLLMPIRPEHGTKLRIKYSLPR